MDRANLRQNLQRKEEEIVDTPRYWLGVVLHGLLVVEGITILGFLLTGLPSFITIFLAALITGVVLDHVAGRSHLENGKYWLRTLLISVLIVVVQLVFTAVGLNLLPWTQYVLVTAIAYVAWDGLIGRAIGSETVAHPAHA